MNSGHQGTKTPSFLKNSLCLGVFLLFASSIYANDDNFFQQTLVQINQQRAKVKVQNVSFDNKLMKIAQTWADKSAKADNQKHRSQADLKSLLDELNYSHLNENLYYAKNIAGGKITPEQVVNGWMNSPGHRRNLLKDRIDKIGLGIARAANGGYYVVFNGADTHPPKVDESANNESTNILKKLQIQIH